MDRLDLLEEFYKELKYATRSIHREMHERQYQGDKSLNVPLLDCPHENCRKRLGLLAKDDGSQGLAVDEAFRLRASVTAFGAEHIDLKDARCVAPFWEIKGNTLTRTKALIAQLPSEKSK